MLAASLVDGLALQLLGLCQIIFGNGNAVVLAGVGTLAKLRPTGDFIVRPSDDTFRGKGGDLPLTKPLLSATGKTILGKKVQNTL